MSTHPFTNTHIHIFSSDCVPQNFLRVMPQKNLKRIAPHLLRLLQTNAGKNMLRFLRFVNRNRVSKNMYDRYISFLGIGLQENQQDVLNIELETLKQYDSSVRTVVLTLNMDYMDDKPATYNYQSQLKEVMDIKRRYPDILIPFLGIEPRIQSNSNLLTWAKTYLEIGFKIQKTQQVYPFFYGLKLYPALGYFPFDKRMWELYRYAEEKKLPVMTHTTRVGSQYIGTKIEDLIPKNIDAIYPEVFDEASLSSKLFLSKLIDAYYLKGWIKNSKIGDNDFACDLFSHPKNYIPILKTFPNLKLCLAHMGGANEIVRDTTDKNLLDIRKIDTELWFDTILNMMKVHQNLYTDISYTLSSFDLNNKNGGDLSYNEEVLRKTKQLINTVYIDPIDNKEKSLGDRVLFGTDFFMTEQEGKERELFSIACTALGEPIMTKIARDNPKIFLGI